MLVYWVLKWEIHQKVRDRIVIGNGGGGEIFGTHIFKFAWLTFGAVQRSREFKSGYWTTDNIHDVIHESHDSAESVLINLATDDEYEDEKELFLESNGKK